MDIRHLKIAVLICISIILTFGSGRAGVTYDEKHIEVALRMIGHQVLLNADDSTSRVLPIVLENGQYIIKFETEFGFNPDQMVETVTTVMRETEMADGYIMEVKECNTGKVMYSYEMGLEDNSGIIPCKKRDLPKACYNLLFTLSGVQDSDSSVAVDILDNASFGSYFYTGGLFLILLMGLVSFLWKRKKVSGIDPDLISIGKYQFNTRKSKLIIENHEIELTSKESDLLLLLYQSINTTVQREVILSKVWGDEGDYVGRTLDVFISKLRKKLERDNDVNIVNVRGVGYKLVMDS